jgi:transcriptional regulator with XRE-family HTH domain
MAKRVVSQAFPGDPFISDATVFGKAVRAARTLAGLSIEQAALSLGISKQTLSDIEAGKSGMRFENILKVAQGLGLHLFVVQSHMRDRISSLLNMRAS